MGWALVHQVIVFLQHCVATFGILIIVTGVGVALYRYFFFLASGAVINHGIHKTLG